MGIRLKDLSKLGYRDNVARSLVVNIVSKHCKYDTKEQIEMTLSDILEHPESYKNNEIWNKLAERLSPTIIAKEFIAYDLLDEPLMYKTYGGKFIETLAKQQMNLAMRLPVTVAGALMPDAHAGYGLPIGGVLATDNVVIPYAVGVDIGCRMSLTIFDASADFLKRYTYQMKEALKDFTHFGMDGGLVLNLAKALGLKPLANVNNHHNFAWREEIAPGRMAIVHRKGATPAQKGQAGLIPGSMATAGYLVCGKGMEAALNSASHGAGRAMSRQKAKDSFTQSSLKKLLSQAGVTLIGGSVEEMPLAYKDIDRVMYTQETLVEVQGKFMPRIVRMNKE